MMMDEVAEAAATTRHGGFAATAKGGGGGGGGGRTRQLHHDSFEEFMQRVFESPDLPFVSSFNDEYGRYITVGADASPANTTNKKSDGVHKTTPTGATRAQEDLPITPNADAKQSSISLLDAANNNVISACRIPSVEGLRRSVRWVREMVPETYTLDDVATDGRRLSAKGCMRTDELDYDTLQPRAEAYDMCASDAQEVSNDYALGTSNVGIERFLRRRQSQGGKLRDVVVSSVLGVHGRAHGVAFASLSEDRYVACCHDSYCFLRSVPSYGSSLPPGCRVPSMMAPIQMQVDAPLAVFAAHRGSIQALAVSHDCTMLASAGADRLLSLYDLTTLRCIASFDHPDAVTTADFSTPRKFVATGCLDGCCRLWMAMKVRQSAPVCVYSGHRHPIVCVVCQPHGELVASGCRNGDVHLWTAVSTRLHRVVGRDHHRTAIHSLAFNASGTTLLSGDGFEVLLSDVETGAPFHVFKSSIHGTVVSPPDVATCVDDDDDEVDESGNFAKAFFAPKPLFANFLFLCTRDRTVSLVEFHAYNTTAAAAGVKGGAATAAEDAAMMASQTKAAANASAMRAVRRVDVTQDVWSSRLRGVVSSVCVGPQQHIILGDGNGNITVLKMEPQLAEVQPPPRIVQRVLR